MDYILLASIIIWAIGNFFICRYFFNKSSSTQSKLLSDYRKEMLGFSIIQKQNTEKLVELLNKLFVNSPQEAKPEPNDIGKINEEGIEFTEENPITLPKDIKFEVEGGDTFIPPGYSQSN